MFESAGLRLRRTRSGVEVGVGSTGRLPTSLTFARQGRTLFDESAPFPKSAGHRGDRLTRNPMTRPDSTAKPKFLLLIALLAVVGCEGGRPPPLPPPRPPAMKPPISERRELLTAPPRTLALGDDCSATSHPGCVSGLCLKTDPGLGRGTADCERSVDLSGEVLVLHRRDLHLVPS